MLATTFTAATSLTEEFEFEGRSYQRCFDPNTGRWGTREIGAAHPDAWQLEHEPVDTHYPDY